MRGRKFLIVLAALAVLVVGGPSTAAPNSCTANGCTNTDNNNNTVEPLATRSSLAVVTDNQVWPTDPRLGAANIKSFNFSGTGGALTAVITTEHPMPNGDPLQDLDNYPLTYAGVHVLMTFQTNWIEVNQTVNNGGTPNDPDDDLRWNDLTGAAHTADGFRWTLAYGATLNHPGKQCFLGFYDPTGRLDPTVPVGVGQVFFTLGQSGQNTTCTLSNGDRTVTIRVPYVYQWESSTGEARAVRVVGNAPGAPTNPSQVRNITAFSWMDTEGGTPEVDQDFPDNPGPGTPGVPGPLPEPIPDEICVDPADPESPCLTPEEGTPDDLGKFVNDEFPDELHEGGLVLGLTWYTDSVPANAYRYGAIAGDPNPSKIPTERCTTNALGGVEELPPPYNTTG
ncbi:MAG: hypothetical protein ACRDJM_05040, partial [Actinomycetota bacterium]